MSNEYVIELEDSVFVDNDTGEELRRVLGFKSLVFDNFGLQMLKPFDERCKSEVDAAFDNGYSKGHDDGYEQCSKEIYSSISSEVVNPEDDDSMRGYYQGVRDLWEVVRRIILPSSRLSNSIQDHVEEIFRGEDSTRWNIKDIFLRMDPVEVMERVSEYDNQNNLDILEGTLDPKVGDQIKLSDDKVGVIFEVDDKYVRGYFYPESAMQPVPFALLKSSVVLTGKHVDNIESVIKLMNV